jgi:hypothetical protein
MDDVWDSVVVVSLFSVFVILTDEWRYRRRKRRLRRATKAKVLRLKRPATTSRAAGLRGR